MLAHPNAVYEILEIAASGSYGTVCIVRERNTSKPRTLALKVLNLQHNRQEGLLRRARDEARILSRLSHPNLVQVEPVLQVFGRPVVIMEFVPGATLEQLIQTHPEGTSVAEGIEIIRQAALGLAAAWHTPVGPTQQPMHIVHRDIKPANLMVSNDGDVKVVDFGLAKARFSDRESTTTALVLGSRGYMAPERNEGIDQTPAGDIYALGLTLFELLSAKKLVASMRSSKHDADIVRHVGHLEPQNLSEAGRAKLHALIVSMCSFKPDQRPEMKDIPDVLLAILAEDSLTPDLQSFAQQAVQPIYDARKQIEPIEHKKYADVAFLEEEPPADLKVSMDMNPWTDDHSLTNRSGELADLIASYPHSDVGPLLELLDKALVPGWKFWKRQPPQAVVVGALNALSSRTETEVLHRVKKLQRHKNAAIANAASALLAQATGVQE